MGGKSRTQATTQTSQVTETTSTGLQDTEGFAVAGGGDVEVNLQTTDAGAVQGAFEFGGDAFQFASDAANRAAETSERALETSQAAAATVATRGESDISKIDSKTIGIAIAGLVAILVLPQVFRRAA